MAIKDPLMFITIEEFKNWKGFNNQLFDEIITPDSEIRYAIEIASSNIDYLSGFTISKKWPEINPTKFTDNIQTATNHYVNFLLSKGVEYARGQASIGQGGIVYSQNNPEEPYFIPPQVFNYLREINEYLNIKGFNLKGIEPQTNRYFNKFISNYGEDSPLNAYIPYPNIKSLDDRTKITITHPLNMLRPVVNIDTSNIKTDIDNSLWEVNKDNPNFINTKNDKGISANNKRIIDVGTPTFLTDATTKIYVDDLLDKKQGKRSKNLITTAKTIVEGINENKGNIDKKQDKLTAGENITIDENNKISATGKLNPNNFYTKEEIDNKWLEDFPNDFKTNANYNEIENLQTEAKQIVTAINENKTNIDKKQDKLISTEEVVIKDNKITFTREGIEAIGNFIIHFQTFNDLTTVSKFLISAINELNAKKSNAISIEPIKEVWKEVAISDNFKRINYIFKDKTHYRFYYNGEIRNTDINKIGKGSYEIKNFYYMNDKLETISLIYRVVIKSPASASLNVIVSIYKNYIEINDGYSKLCNLWKLEELQE